MAAQLGSKYLLLPRMITTSFSLSYLLILSFIVHTFLINWQTLIEILKILTLCQLCNKRPHVIMALPQQTVSVFILTKFVDSYLCSLCLLKKSYSISAS